jgi:hypothetical protein
MTNDIEKLLPNTDSIQIIKNLLTQCRKYFLVYWSPEWHQDVTDNYEEIEQMIKCNTIGHDEKINHSIDTFGELIKNDYDPFFITESNCACGKMVCSVCGMGKYNHPIMHFLSATSLFILDNIYSYSFWEYPVVWWSPTPKFFHFWSSPALMETTLTVLSTEQRHYTSRTLPYLPLEIWYEIMKNVNTLDWSPTQ